MFGENEEFSTTPLEVDSFRTKKKSQAFLHNENGPGSSYSSLKIENRFLCRCFCRTFMGEIAINYCRPECYSTEFYAYNCSYNYFIFHLILIITLILMLY